jgi:hypothetical protein
MGTLHLVDTLYRELRVVRALLFCLSLMLLPALAVAQDTSVLAAQINRAAASTEIDDALLADLRDGLWQIVYLSAGQAEVGEILSFRRADIQAGAGSGASGTTSAVLNPLLPAIFGVAFEDGAITRSVSGSTISLKVAPVGLICAARPLAAAAVARRDEEACRTFWRRFGISASFDTTRGEKSTKLEDLQTLNNQFAALTVRAEVLNLRTSTGERYRKMFQSEFVSWKEKATAFAAIDRDTPEILKAQAVVEARLLALVKQPDWKGKPVDQRAAAIRTILKEAVAQVTVPDAQATHVRDAWLAALRADRALQNAVANAPVLTAEYAFERPDLATEPIGTIVPEGIRPPNLHSARAIYAQGLTRTNLDFTANASLSWFDDVRPGMSGSFRDFKAGFAGTFRLRDLANYGAPALSFAALYMYLHQEPLGLSLVAFNDAEINKPGHIGVFQAKLEFPTAKNAMRIPLSFTYSNRTELINETDVRGQIGISFNLDALFVEGK